jgi:hypothetical protein
VKSVLDDGDLSIYQGLPGPKFKVGETIFPDSFLGEPNKETGERRPVGKVYIDQDITDYVKGLASEAASVDTVSAYGRSRNGGPYDIKMTYPGHESKSYHGFLFEGKYISLRDAGNILAGINAASHGESFDSYMRGAGGYQKLGLLGAGAGYLLGAKFGPPPYYGEEPWTGASIKYGYGLQTGLHYSAPNMWPDP